MSELASDTVSAPRLTVVGDSWMMTWRLLKQIQRVPDVLIYSIIQPVMFVVLFRYVLGGAIDVGGAGYIQYLMPGVFVQTLMFNGAATAIGMADDVQKGLVDRFRSLPISRSALLIGRATSDLVRSVVVFAAMLVVGIAVGFRFSGGFGGALAGTALMLLSTFAFSWVGILIGLTVRTTEAAQSAGLIWLFPLTFASSAFVPTRSMPGWLQAFAKVNPVTVLTNSVRRLYLSDRINLQVGTPHLPGQLWQALGWLIGIVVVFAPLAVRRYRRMSG